MQLCSLQGCLRPTCPNFGNVDCLKRQPFDIEKEKNADDCQYPILPLFNMIYPPAKCIEGKYYLPYILPKQQKLSCKRAITATILRMITYIELDLYCTMTWPVLYNDISFCKLLVKSMHSCKSEVPYLGQNFADVYQYLIWPVFYNDIPFCKLLMKSIHSFKPYWLETNILTQQLKTKSKVGHNSANFDAFL